MLDDFAKVSASQFLDWPAKKSYQTLIDNLEAAAGKDKKTVMLNVRGDEDNGR
jgi:hypothetical protein